MVNNYFFANIIDNEFYKILEEVPINWTTHSLHRSGRDMIIEKDRIYYYMNSNVRRIHTIEDIIRTIKRIESTPYRNDKIKELELTNYRTIFNALQKWERQKKLTLVLNQ